MEQAVIRKVREETGLTVETVQPLGYYEAVSQENPFGLASPLHAVSVVFSTVVDDPQQIRLDDQSSDWKFFKELPADFHINRFGDGCG
jgi:ADP-ribose pyrophosphatase YjhB (NUDIX family)